MTIKKTNVLKLFTVLLFGVLLLGMSSISSLAAENTAALTIPVTKQVTGNPPGSAASFSFLLEAVTENAPMPEGAVNGRCTVDIRGAGTAAFKEIVYTEPNDYYYRVSENTEELSGYRMDDTEYTVLVRVTIAQNGTLAANMMVYREKTEEKQDEILFVNSYTGTAPGTTDTPVTPEHGDMPKTGDDSQWLLWFLLMAAGVAAGAILLVRRRRLEVRWENHEEKDGES